MQMRTFGFQDHFQGYRKRVILKATRNEGMRIRIADSNDYNGFTLDAPSVM